MTPVSSAVEEESPAAGGRSETMAASMPRSSVPARANGLRGGLQVVHPIAGSAGLERASPFEFALSEAGADGANASVGTGTEGDSHPALERHREHGEVVIIDVLADQVYASGNREHRRRGARTEPFM